MESQKDLWLLLADDVEALMKFAVNHIPPETYHWKLVGSWEFLSSTTLVEILIAAVIAVILFIRCRRRKSNYLLMHEAENSRLAPSTPRWSLTPSTPAQPEEDTNDKKDGSDAGKYDEQISGTQSSVHVTFNSEHGDVVSAEPTVHFKTMAVNSPPTGFMTAPIPENF